MPRIHLSVRELSGPFGWSESSRWGFASSEGLRALLCRLHESGPGAWRDDLEAGALMRFVIDRYAALARKHDLEPADAACAAFEAMLNESTRTAEDPWAVVTVAVVRTLTAEERANGLLCSTERARRKEVSVFHDAERFSDRENELAEYHPALQTTGGFDEEPDCGQRAQVDRAVDGMATLLVVLGWPADAATAAVDYVCSRLIETGDRRSAYEYLRRDKAARVNLDLSHQAWIGLLRLILGHPGSPSPLTRCGALVRLLVGDLPIDLLEDDRLVRTAALANPGGTPGALGGVA